MTQPGQIQVTVKDLHDTAADFRNIADQAKRQMDFFDGIQGELTTETDPISPGFDTLKATRSCEQSWQQALEYFAAKLAVAAEKLDKSADTYVKTDQDAMQALLNAGGGLH